MAGMFLPREKLEENQKKLRTTEFDSNLKFVKDHNGWRRGKTHNVIGPKGGAKSTLIKTFILEMAMRGKRVYTYLSEESVVDYSLSINSAVEKMFSNETRFSQFKDLYSLEQQEGIRKEYLSNLFADSEMDLSDDEQRNFFPWLKNRIAEVQPEIIIIDNLTTSFLSSNGLNFEAKAQQEIRKISYEIKAPLIQVFHTAKGAHPARQVLTGEDVRGNATSVNKGDYNYILQAIFEVNPPRVFIQTEKARYHKEANRKFYELEFDKELEIFSGCKDSSFQELLSVIKQACPRKFKTSAF
jgi:hypothetical protein